MSTRKRIVRHGFPDGKRNSIRKFIPLTLALILGLSTFLPVLGGSGLGAQSVYAADPTTFTIRIENISGDSNLPTPFAPGVWAVHRPITRPLFQTNQPDRGDGLVALAEDGNPGELATSLSTANGVFSSGVFNTPVGSDGPGPLLPGGVYEFQITAEPGDYLSFASMLVQSNDLFVGPGPRGIDLFDGRDRPISGDITDQSPLWDVGSEANEAPGLGPNQAPRQSGPNTGPGEGGVSAFSNTTRSLPLPGHIVDVDIKESDGTFTFTIHNTSTRSGAIDTPIAPVFYATHNANWRLFSNGEPASPGLESLAEDGSPVGLVGEHSGAIGTEMVGAQPITRERPDAEPGPAFPGESYEFSVTPSIAYPNLTIAMMVVQTNDVFLAFGAKGVALLDYAGHPRATEDILADVERELAIWDAGTEMNEVPGVGVHQAPRQAGPNMGAADPVPGVRLYNDSTNDLTGPNAGGFGTITVVNGETAGTFDVTLQNTSDQTVYPGVLTPAVYAIHSGNTQLFEPGMPASSGLERLSEDGNPTALVNESNNNSDVASVGVANTPSGASEPGPLTPGDSYQFSVTADAVNRYFSVASMIVPSNDTFFAFEPEGLRLMNQDGTPRSDAEIAADIATQRLAWDAGTERNQAGAAGPDQAPRQAGPNTGADEGNGKVRLLDDPVWSHPKASDVVRIPIVPTRSMPELPDDEPLPADPIHAPVTFKVLLENISGDSDLPTPFAPGVFAVHNASRPLFTDGRPDRGEGLAALAEDGNPADLAAALAVRDGVASVGVFNTPVGASGPAPIFPGEIYEFEFTTTPEASRLSLATMLVQSNDLFAAPGEAGIPLFPEGIPLSGDITHLLPLWDVGSEVNEAPGMGPNQAPRQGAANTGATEGGVFAFTNSTRSLPLAGGIVDVIVSEKNGTFTFTIVNNSASKGAIVTPIAPIFYATHNETWRLFTTGESASLGLEGLAEDGGPGGLVGEHSGAAGTEMVGAQPITDQRPNDAPGPAFPGESYTFSVTPSTAYPNLTIAMMVVQTNDAFLAFGAEGLALLDADGNPRSLAEIEHDINRTLAVWDAGTEKNEVPGVGVNQAPRQSGPNVGDADPIPGVRLYSDATNDLAGSQAGGFGQMTIEHGDAPNTFVVTIQNTSDTTVYPGVLTPVVWAIHTLFLRNGKGILFVDAIRA